MELWEIFIKESYSKGSYLPLGKMTALLNKSLPHLLDRIPKGKKVNIVDFANLFLSLKDQNTINLVFFVEVTFGNVENTERTLYNFKLSLGQDDFFIVTNRIDSLKTRTQLGSVSKKMKCPFG